MIRSRYFLTTAFLIFLTGCAQLPTKFPNYANGPSVSVSTKTFDSGGIGDYQVPNSDIVIRSPSNIAGGSAGLIGPIGVMLVANAQAHANQKRVAEAASALAIKFGPMLQDSITKARSTSHKGTGESNISLLQIDAQADIKLTPYSLFYFKQEGKSIYTIGVVASFFDPEKKSRRLQVLSL